MKEHVVLSLKRYKEFLAFEKAISSSNHTLMVSNNFCNPVKCYTNDEAVQSIAQMNCNLKEKLKRKEAIIFNFQKKWWETIFD